MEKPAITTGYFIISSTGGNPPKWTEVKPSEEGWVKVSHKETAFKPESRPGTPRPQ